MLPTHLANIFFYLFYVFYILSFTYNVHISFSLSLVDIFMALFLNGMRSHGLVRCKVFIHCSYKLIGLMMARETSRNM
jgi:hypothetical protein